nr:hypothetical protein [Naumannella halotolerans]
MIISAPSRAMISPAHWPIRTDRPSSGPTKVATTTGWIASINEVTPVLTPRATAA